MVGRASETVRQTFDQAKEAVRGAKPGEALESASRYAQESGAAAYGTITAHPFASAVIGAIGFYLLLGRRSRESEWERGYRHARSAASDYADQARESLMSYSPSDIYASGRDYALRGGQVLSRQMAAEPLAAAVGFGLIAWMLGAWLSGGRE